MAESLHGFFKRLKLFADFSDAELDDWLRASNRRLMSPGDMLCREGERGDKLFIIRDGVVRVERDAGKGEPLILARLSEGMVVGEMALVDDAPRSASLKVEQAGLVYEFSRRDFEAFKDDMHPAAYKLLRAISMDSCERLRQVNGQIQKFIENPTSLFAPQIKSDQTQADEGVKGRVRSFLARFGGKG